jgi:AcrR family transcriptional regulator
LFEKYSFEKTTIEEIARAVPMSKATLYTEFANKDEILLELCRVHSDRMVQSMEELIGKTTSSWLDTLKSFLKIYIETVYDLALTVHSPESLIYVSEKLSGLVREYDRRHLGLIEMVLNKALEAGEICRPIKANLVAEGLLEVLTSYLPPYPSRTAAAIDGRPEKKKLLKQFDLVMNLTLDGLRYKP